MHVSEQPPLPRPYATSVSWHDGAAVVVVRGEVDPSTAPLLRGLLDELRRREPPVIVVDLREVTLLASAGLATLIVVHDQAHPATLLRIVAPSTTPALRSVMLTGLDAVLAVHPTVQAALADAADTTN